MGGSASKKTSSGDDLTRKGWEQSVYDTHPNAKCYWGFIQTRRIACGAKPHHLCGCLEPEPHGPGVPAQGDPLDPGGLLPVLEHGGLALVSAFLLQREDTNSIRGGSDRNILLL